nr:reverse transcriptase domain-containing protein [Tanacetum cinerariifolium]
MSAGLLPHSRKSTGKLNLSTTTLSSVSWTLTKAISRYSLQSQMKRKRLSTSAKGCIAIQKLPFGLKNAGAIYQWLVDKAFDSQIGQNIEVAVEGKFLGYMITREGIKPCHDKTEVVLQLPSPRTIKEVQSLNGKLASLNRFLSKSAKKSLPLFKTLKKCIKKSDFHWTSEAEQAFKQLMQQLLKLRLLVAPKPKEELIVYLSASYRAISAVLMTKRGMVQTPVYFIRRALQGPKLNYTPTKKLVLSLVFAAKRLRSVMLGEHNITYRPRTSVKEQVLADFLTEMSDESPPDASVVETQQESWTLFMDGSSCMDGSGAGLILTSSEGTEFTYALRFQFTASNNESEGMRRQRGKHDQIPGEGQKHGQRLHQLFYKPSTMKQKQECPEQDCVNQIYALIQTGLGTLPSDRKEARKLRIKARQYELLEGVLYRRSFLMSWLRCVRPLQADYVIREIHEESYRPGNVKFLIVAMDYFTKWIEAKAVAKITGEEIKARLGEGNKNWVKELPRVLWAHRIMIKSSHGDTPFSLTYGTEAVIPAEIGMPTYRTTAVDVVHKHEELRINLDLLEERRESAVIHEAKAKLKMTKYYNARVRGVTFGPGDFIYRSNDASHAVDEEKLGPKWEGPYEVTNTLGDGAYKLRSAD